MNFTFGVVCKLTNSFAKSKNSPTPRDFAFRLGKPKVWTPPPNFFHQSRPRVFFPSRHFDVRRACHSPPRPGRRQLPPSPGLRASRRPAQAAFIVRRCRRSRQFGSVHLRPPPREGPREGRSTSVPASWRTSSRRGRVRRRSWTRVSLRGRAAASSVRRRGRRARAAAGGRARAAGRADGRREIARGGGPGGRSPTWKAEIVDAKWWKSLHICKVSTSICKINQIANLICKTIGEVFSTSFRK